MELPIKGWQKTTLIDYPDKIASIIFLSACNFRCGFCHNGDLVVTGDLPPTISEKEILDYLKEKKKWIDGICVSGGEPLLHNELKKFLRRVKEIGILVKIDTNGSNPTFLKELIEEDVVDYIAMDIKNSKEKYNKTCSCLVNISKIEDSVKLLMNSSVDYEFRTTVVPGLHTKEDMVKIGEWIKGCKKYAIQNFKSCEHVIDSKYKTMKGFSREEIEKFKQIIKTAVKEIILR